MLLPDWNEETEPFLRFDRSAVLKLGPRAVRGVLEGRLWRAIKLSEPKELVRPVEVRPKVPKFTEFFLFLASVFRITVALFYLLILYTFDESIFCKIFSPFCELS